MTVNNGYWDFFVNWHANFHKHVANSEDKPWLFVIAEDPAIHLKLKKWTGFKPITTIILPGYDSSDSDSAVQEAEDYNTIAYRKLVSSRATHLLDLMCSFEQAKLHGISTDKSATEGKAKKPPVWVYSDVDTVWRSDPLSYIQKELFGPEGDDSSTRQPKYDILGAVDDRDFFEVHFHEHFEVYYCTGFIVTAQTQLAMRFLSSWESELQSNQQLNQPIFNTLLKHSRVRHGGLDDMKFPPGRLYFDEWTSEGGDSARQKKKDAIVVHNNYIVGHGAKKRRFEEQGLWTAEKIRKVSTDDDDDDQSSK